MKSKKYEDLRQKFGERIRYLRQKKGWSQEELAFEADLNRNYIGDIERGEKNLSLRNIHKLSETFELSMSELLKNLD